MAKEIRNEFCIPSKDINIEAQDRREVEFILARAEKWLSGFEGVSVKPASEKAKSKEKPTAAYPEIK